MTIDPERMFRDFMGDILASASAAHYRARAEHLRAARPRPDDYLGQSTIEDRRDQWRRLTARADACEAHARLLEAGNGAFPEVETVELWEAA